MTPRIPPVRQPDAEQSAALAKTMFTPDGEPLNIFATLAHVPKLMQRFNALGGYFMVHGRIAARDRELAILRTAAHARCDYEVAQHRRLGREAGLAEDEIVRVLDLQNLPASFDSADVALISFVDELIETGSVSDDAWNALDDRFDEIDRMELLLLVGFYRMVAGFLNGARVDIESIDGERLNVSPRQHSKD